MEQNDYLILSEDGKTVIGCNSDYEGVVVIPEGVTEIGESAFEECTKINAITIPSSVTKIGTRAFEECTSLTSIVIPNSVMKIEAGTFSGCKSLTSIKIPDGVTAIEDNVFFGCKSLTSIKIPNNVRYIGDAAFSGCTSLKSIDIPKGVRSMGHVAFSNCTSLTSIKIPSSLTNMTNIAFVGCKKLKEIIVDEGNHSYCSFDGALFSKDMECLIFVPGGKTTFTFPNNEFATCERTFDDCTKLKELIVAQDHPRLRSINGVLYSNDGPELVRFPMGRKTFEIPSYVTKIGYGAFANCTRLISIVIPDSVETIGWRAFASCTHLTEVHLKHNLPIDFSEAFEDSVIPNVTLYVPKGSSEAYRKHEFFSKFKEIIEE